MRAIFHPRVYSDLAEIMAYYERVAAPELADTAPTFGVSPITSSFASSAKQSAYSSYGIIAVTHPSA